jgi:hypothetical protein
LTLNGLYGFLFQKIQLFTKNINYYKSKIIFPLSELKCYPITVAARSEAWTVFVRSNAGIVGSNSVQGMDVCVRLFCVCAVLCAATADPLCKGSYRLCRRSRNWKSGQGPTKGCKTIIIITIIAQMLINMWGCLVRRSCRYSSGLVWECSAFRWDRQLYC